VSECRIIDLLDYASGTADRLGQVDVSGYEGACFIVKFATIAAGAVTTINLQEHDVTSTGQTDIAGMTASVAADDDNQTFVFDYKNPTKKFLTLEIDKDATNATAEVAFAILYNGDARPVTNAATDEMTVVTGQS
jgi:hypothetical protein